MNTISTCTICSLPLIDCQKVHKTIFANCIRCGVWAIRDDYGAGLGNLERKLHPADGWGDKPPSSGHLKSRLSHIIRHQQRTDGRPFLIDLDALWDLKLADPLPAPQEQADNLVLWIGAHQGDPAAPIQEYAERVSAWIGISIGSDGGARGLRWLLNQPEMAEILTFSQRPISPEGHPVGLQLTMKGWSRYDELLHRRVNNRIAFMAMKFGDHDLDRVVEDCFKPAVSEAGFELRMLTDRQGAGLIDDQLRVALRNSRFSIVDLTHGNRGAYWEAGFAEGLGRPVIYTCRKDKWGQKDANDEWIVHFDTSHLVTIIWDPDDLDQAARRLTATIRNTLPDEAIMGV
jgi:hypothetical protein